MHPIEIMIQGDPATISKFSKPILELMIDTMSVFSLVKEVEYERHTARRVPLRDTFFDPALVYSPGKLDEFLVGLATQPRQKYDNIITEEVTNHLFQAKNMSFGMDLVALNIQRGRDHGLPGYNAFRELCGLKRMETFDGFVDLIPKPIVERLKLIYRDVEDVDLFIGGIAESSLPGLILGPVLRCLVGDQFKRTLAGDRFWYDSGDSPASFSETQLAEVRRVLEYIGYILNI